MFAGSSTQRTQSVCRVSVKFKGRSTETVRSCWTYMFFWTFIKCWIIFLHCTDRPVYVRIYLWQTAVIVFLCCNFPLLIWCFPRFSSWPAPIIFLHGLQFQFSADDFSYTLTLSVSQSAVAAVYDWIILFAQHVLDLILKIQRRKNRFYSQKYYLLKILCVVPNKVLAKFT